MDDDAMEHHSNENHVVTHAEEPNDSASPSGNDGGEDRRRESPDRLSDSPDRRGVSVPDLKFSPDVDGGAIAAGGESCRRKQNRRSSSYHFEGVDEKSRSAEDARRKVRIAAHMIASVRGMGERKLGGRMVAEVKRLEKRERSVSRLIRGNTSSVRSSDAGGGSVRDGAGETTPLVDKIGSQGDTLSSPTSLEERAESDGMARSSLEISKELSELGLKPSLWEVLWESILGKWLNVLLVFIPLGILAPILGWSSAAVFWMNFFAMIPLASILGDFTEDLSAHTNQAVGGLINASFGNAVEVVVAIQALLANEIRVVQASMIGSVFSNLLLVLGGCFFFGGLYYDEQEFNSTAATANMALLALSSLALVLPTPFAEYYEIEDEHVLAVSRFASIFLLFMYLQLLVFQLKTHAHLFDDEGGEVAELPFWVDLGGLLLATGLIALLSGYLVDAIDGFCEESGISRTFVGLIILPVVGNAVEHITAVSVAIKNKMDLAMGVAVGSCTQISLFVVPVTVLVGWAFDRNMTLNFPHFEITLYVLSVVIVAITLGNPKGNWLEGSLLMTTYLMIAIGFWYEKVVDF